MINSIWYVIIASYATIVLCQDYGTNCKVYAPRGCLDNCLCAFCTTNETLADGLINGTINPKTLSNKKDTDEETCTNGKCPDGYYLVGSASIIEENGRSCGFEVIYIMFIVVFSIGGFVLFIACLCCLVRSMMNRKNKGRKEEYIALVEDAKL